MLLSAEVSADMNPGENCQSDFKLIHGFKPTSVKTIKTSSEQKLPNAETSSVHSNSQDAKVAPRRRKNRKLASRDLKAYDVLHLIRTSGMTLPINSRK
jgi:hypothetical protein